MAGSHNAPKRDVKESSEARAAADLKEQKEFGFTDVLEKTMGRLEKIRLILDHIDYLSELAREAKKSYGSGKNDIDLISVSLEIDGGKEKKDDVEISGKGMRGIVDKAYQDIKQIYFSEFEKAFSSIRTLFDEKKSEERDEKLRDEIKKINDKLSSMDKKYQDDLKRGVTDAFILPGALRKAEDGYDEVVQILWKAWDGSVKYSKGATQKTDQDRVSELNKELTGHSAKRTMGVILNYTCGWAKDHKVSLQPAFYQNSEGETVTHVAPLAIQVEPVQKKGFFGKSGGTKPAICLTDATFAGLKDRIEKERLQVYGPASIKKLASASEGTSPAPPVVSDRADRKGPRQ